MFAGQHGVEGLFDPFAPLGFWPNGFMIVDDSVRIAPCPSTITDDLSGNFSLWDKCEGKHGRSVISAGKCALARFVFFRGKVVRDLERQNSAVMVMPEDQRRRQSSDVAAE